MQKLDERLEKVASFVSEGASIADIGTDHAYLALYLKEHGAKKVIAADKNFGPCESARHTIAEAGLSEEIEVRQGDGLFVLEQGEVDTLCIAGMGGELISNILSARPLITQSMNRLVLQPMNETALLRRWLLENGWYIKDEALAKAEGKLYEIICAEKGEREDVEDVLLYIGKRLYEKKPSLLEEHILELEKKLRWIINGMEKSAKAKESARCLEMKKFLAKLEEKRKCLAVK